MRQSAQSETDWASILTGEILLLNLVGKALYLLPEKDWMQGYLDEELYTESPFGGGQEDIVSGLDLMRNWCKCHQDGLSDDRIKDLKAEYTHLFIGTSKLIASPFESVYLSEFPQVFQEQTLQVRGWYRRFGLEPEKIYKEPDDHIGLETAFIAHLAQLGLAALDAGDSEKFQSLLDAQRQFLIEHLLIWGPHWCGLVIENAKSDFYRGMALLLRGGLNEIKDKLGAIPGEVIE